jgi:hypothetical protein
VEVGHGDAERDGRIGQTSVLGRDRRPLAVATEEVQEATGDERALCPEGWPRVRIFAQQFGEDDDVSR